MTFTLPKAVYLSVTFIIASLWGGGGHVQALEPTTNVAPPYSLYQTVSLVDTIPTQNLPEQPYLASVVQNYSDVVGQNPLRDYIFAKESGYSLTSVNQIGCIGLGQDCNHWLETGRLNSPVCPDWRTNLTCQLAYWDWYANTVYGGWGPAQAFRSSHNYW